MKKGQGENPKGRHKPKKSASQNKRGELERVTQTKSGQALASDILKRTSMGQSEERMCEQSENPKLKQFELKGWDFQDDIIFCH